MRVGQEMPQWLTNNLAPVTVLGSIIPTRYLWRHNLWVHLFLRDGVFQPMNYYFLFARDAFKSAMVQWVVVGGCPSL